MGTRPVSASNGLEFSHCPVCETDHSVLWMDDHKVTRYVRCTDCGTVYASPRAPHRTRYAWLDSTFSAGQMAFEIAARRQHALKIEAAVIQRYIQGGAMLDVGCDLGGFFEWFPSPAWEKYGVDVSVSAARYAGQTYSAQAFPGTVREAAFPSCSFDLVTMMDMLYYSEDPSRDLIEVSRILKPKGMLAIELCGHHYQLARSRGPLCFLLDHRWTRLQTDSAYLYWFTPVGLRRLLDKSGFEIVHWEVIPSPHQSSVLLAALSGFYYGLTSALASLSFELLGLAPKYLYIARPKTARAEGEK